MYSEWDDTNSEYNTFYRLVEYDATSWTDIKQVTDFEGEAGGFPSITTSANRIHVAYTNSDELSPGSGAGNPVKNRDRLNSTWQDPTTIFSNDASRCFVIATGSKLHAFYYELDFPVFKLQYKSQSFGSTSWSSATELQSASDPENSHVDMAVTADDKLHIVYYDEKYRVWDGSWSGTFTFQTGVPSVYNQKISANSNDIYVIWYEFVSGVGDKLKLRQRDFAPLAPQNLTVSGQVGQHPLLQWDANAEGDLNAYKIYKKRGNEAWQYLNTVNNSTTSYEDYQETIRNLRGDITARYRITAVDLAANESAYSNEVAIQVEGIFWKIPANTGEENEIPTTLAILQNYPNPFNPTTTIQFTIPEAQALEITVYSLTGQKIATLAAGVLEEGFHQVEWDGKDARGNTVSSGVYIYQLKTGKQRMVKKMLLAK